MSFPWFVARRYLTARRRQAFISLISAVSILGVGVGVMALIIALGLMTGVQTELRDRIVGSSAHVYVSRVLPEVPDLGSQPERWMKPGVVGAAPAIFGFGLLTATSGQNPKAVTVKGIDVDHEPDVTDLSQAIVKGSLIALVTRSPEEKDGVILGEEVARSLDVSVGDIVTVVTSEFTSTPGGFAPRPHPLAVVGIFRFGFFQIDDSQVLISMAAAKDLFNREGPDMVQLKLARMDDAPVLRDQLRRELGAGYDVRDWTEMNQPLYSALWLEKIAISLTIGLIVMVAALNIVASLVLLVMEKSRDIAILRTMGAPAGMIRRIFIYQGLTIGLVGTFGGTILGLLVCAVANRYQLIKLPADVYQITYLPFRIQPLDATVVVVSAVAVCLLATIYPSRQAAGIDPAEALRNQ